MSASRYHFAALSPVAGRRSRGGRLAVRLAGLFVMVGLAAAACTPTQSVSVVHHSRLLPVAASDQGQPRTVFVEHPDDSLKQADFAAVLAARLTAGGFRVVDDRAEADYVARMAATMGEPTVHLHETQVPEYVTTSRLVRDRNGNLVPLTETFFMGFRTESFSYSRYPAVVALYLTDRESGEAVFEGEVKTNGACDKLEAMVGPLLQTVVSSMLRKTPNPDATKTDAGTIERGYVELPTC